jgi:hypothetical protein
MQTRKTPAVIPWKCTFSFTSRKKATFFLTVVNDITEKPELQNSY